MLPKPQMTLKRKIQLASDLTSGMTEKIAQSKYACGKGTIYRVKQDMESLLVMDKKLISDTKKRKKVSKFEILDESILEWIKKARDMNCIVTGPIVQAIAIKLARLSNITEFKASNGWLEHFRKRNKIVSRLLEGERGGAPVTDADSFKARLPEPLALYDVKNVMNADEVGLFYEQTGRKTLILQGNDLAGTKVQRSGSPS